MKRTSTTTFVLSIFLLLAGCQSLGEQFSTLPSQKINSSEPAQGGKEIKQIFALLLTSHTTWQTLAGEAEITFYAPDGSSQKFINQFEFSAPYKAYIESVESGNADNKVIWISDSENYLVT